MQFSKDDIIKISFKLVLLFAFGLISQQTISQHLVINEIQSSNATTIADEDGDYEDWIELYNGTDTAINLAGYYLSDNINNLQMWIFPEVIIEPQGFIIVFASGKNRVNSSSLHTNFSIDRSGEAIALSYNNQIIDYFAPVILLSDISYGRYPDGSINTYYFHDPSPNAPNSENRFTEVLSPVIFSHSGGFYTGEFFLELNHPDPDVTIIYTIDGSEPDINNLDGTTYLYKNKYAFYPHEELGELLEDSFHSYIYNGEILISDRSNQPDKLAKKSTTVHDMFYEPVSPVFKSTPIRAIAYKEGSHKSAVKTHTFFVSPQGREKYPIPVIAINLSENALFDYENGIYTAGIDADTWRLDNPDLTYKWMFEGNFHRRGDNAEFPANFEFFNMSSEYANLNQSVGLRLHGNATRSFQMKSLRLYARSAYENNYMNHPFFPNNNISSFKRLILRNSGNDFPSKIWEPGFYSRTLLRDAAIQSMVRHLNIDTQDYLATVVFINGEFWGIHNLRERFDKYYLHNKYGVETDAIDLITGLYTVKEGSNIHFLETYDFIKDNPMETDANYNFIKQRIDIENFIDYQIVNIYSDNTDWPGNNIDFWRTNNPDTSENAKYGHDGKWRWMLYDTDFGFGLWGADNAYLNNTLEFATAEDGPSWPNPPAATLLLRKLLENNEFKQSFIDRFEYHLTITFEEERVLNIIDSLANIIEPIITEHSHRWNQDQLSLFEWHENLSVMKNFAIYRPCVMRTHIMEFFEIIDDEYASGICAEDSVEPDPNIDPQISFSLYPNPTPDLLFIDFPDDIYYTVNIQIYDYTGREISGIRKSIQSKTVTLDVSSLSPGFYLLSADYNNQKHLLKFVKTN